MFFKWVCYDICAFALHHGRSLPSAWALSANLYSDVAYPMLHTTGWVFWEICFRLKLRLPVFPKPGVTWFFFVLLELLFWSFHP